MRLIFIIIFLSFWQNQNEINLLIANAAQEQVGVTTEYDPAYVKISYPGGDLPIKRGVCADVIIRAFRKIGVDLQKEIHEDMMNNFGEYPNYWNMRTTDTNIDHRRVPNLMTYFKRKQRTVDLDSDFRTGDVVAWRLPSGNYHIGIISAETVPGTKRNFMIHNIGYGAKQEDILFKYKIIGHYRW